MWNPLDDLDPVAGGILCGDQREGRSSATREAHHLSVEDNVLAIEVGRQLDRLAGLYLLELHFLEVGVDVGGLDRNDGHQLRAGLDTLADLDLAARNDAVDGRADECALGVCSRGGARPPGRASAWGLWRTVPLPTSPRLT